MASATCAGAVSSIAGVRTVRHGIRIDVQLPGRNQDGIDLVMSAPASRHQDLPTARTVRFPQRLRERIATDAERCGRSFEAQVIAILRRHYGEDVDIAPGPDAILALARASVAGTTAAERRLLTGRHVGGGSG
ncbi:MAG: hypothetical protein HY744_15620 [Deltaproteobacteria bacterium]|nr:hypothetical protein [Deltaproteobacteria bacterium]